MVLQQYSYLSQVGNKSLFKRLPCDAKDMVCHSQDFSVDPKFVFMHETFFHDLGLRLPLNGFEHEAFVR